MIDQEFVKYIVTSLVSQPDQVKVERTVDERGVLLTLHVADDDLGRDIGRKGSTAQSLRVLLRALGSKNEAHYNLRIADNNTRPDSDRPAREERTEEAETDSAPTETEAEDETSDLQDENDFAGTAEPEPEPETEPEEEKTDSLADQTKKELDDLNDLDL